MNKKIVDVKRLHLCKKIVWETQTGTLTTPIQILTQDIKFPRFMLSCQIFETFHAFEMDKAVYNMVLGHNLLRDIKIDILYGNNNSNGTE